MIVLITKDTRDETYYWVAKRKERRMKRIIGRMQKEEVGAGASVGKPGLPKGEQTTISDYA